MARFMERFEEHMEADPALREEYERLEPRFRAISALIKARGGHLAERTREADAGEPRRDQQA